MPRGIPNTTSSSIEQLQTAMAEIKERLNVERKRDGQRRSLRTFLGHMTLLTKKDATKIVVETLNGQRGSKPVQSLHTKSARPLRTDKLKPAKGTVGKVIRAARLKAGLSTSSLGKRVGCGSGSISGYEAGGKIPGPAVRARLSKALGGLSPSLFINGDVRHAGA